MRVPRSCPAAPPAAPPPALFPSPSSASSALAARALTSGTSVERIGRAREFGNLAPRSSSPVTLATGKATRGGEERRGAERSAAPSLGPSPPDTRRIHFSANSLPPLLPPKLWPSRPRPPSSPTPTPRHSHKPQRPAAKLSCLVTTPRAPGGGDRVPSRGGDDRKPKEHLSPPFPRLGRGRGCFQGPAPTPRPSARAARLALAISWRRREGQAHRTGLGTGKGTARQDPG